MRRLVIAVACATAAACATNAPGVRLIAPTVTVERIRALQLDSLGLLAEVLMRVENPNPFPLHLEKVSYDLRFEERPTARGETLEPIEVPARGVASVPVRLRAPYRSVLAAGAVLLFMGEIPYVLHMNLHFGTPVGTVTVPVEHEGKLTLPQVMGGQPF